MNLGNAFGIHEQALLLRNRRSEVLASNIANADTPGFKAQDIDFREALKKQMVPSVRLKATHAGHIQASPAHAFSGQLKYRIPDQPSLDGNTVDIQREQVEFATNSMQFQATLRFLNGKISGIRAALKGE